MPRGRETVSAALHLNSLLHSFLFFSFFGIYSSGIKKKKNKVLLKIENLIHFTETNCDVHISGDILLLFWGGGGWGEEIL
jgi:hypothetical protein